MYRSTADLIAAAILALRPDRPYTIVHASIKEQTVTLHLLGDAEHIVWSAASSSHPSNTKPSTRKGSRR
jgi:hypothetical protein